MPTLADLNRRYSSLQTSVENVISVSESFVNDFRSNITPVQAVETKLGNVLLRKALGMSSSPKASSRKPR